MVLISKFVQGAVRMVRAASSGAELDIQSAKLAGTANLFSFFLFQHWFGGPHSEPSPAFLLNPRFQYW